MSFTLRELLDTPSLALDVLVEGDLDGEVRWVHATEQPDPSPYLRGGEVILTDGVQLRSGTAPEEYVRRLRATGVVAIGYGLVPGVPPAPKGLIDACAAERMTLFQVPVEVPYLAISEVFVERLNADRQAALVATVSRNERLMQAATAGGGLRATLEVLSAELGRPACVLDPQGRVMVSTGGPVEGLERWWTHPVVSIDRTEAVLAVRENGTELSIDERGAADQAAGFLALQLVHERALRETHRRFALELLELLDAGDAAAAGVAMRLRAFGIAPEAPVVVLAAECDGPEEHVDEVERALAGADLPAMAAARAGHVFVVAQWEQPAPELPGLARLVAQAVGGGAPIGVGGIAHTSAGLHRSLTEALDACAVARRREAVRLVTHDEMGSHRLLLALQDEHVVSSLSESLLDPIVRYDARRNAALLETLSAFLESNGHWQATADALHIHVNTLRHRLARVEELTGRSLDTIDGRVDLFLALRARSLAFASGTRAPY